MLMSSCSKDLELEASLSVPAPTDTMEMQEVEFEFTMSFEDMDDLRISQRVDASGRPKSYMRETQKYEEHIELVFLTKDTVYYDREYDDSHFFEYYDHPSKHIYIAKLVGLNEAFHDGQVAYRAIANLPSRFLGRKISVVGRHLGFHNDIDGKKSGREDLRLLKPNAEGFLDLPEVRYFTDKFELDLSQKQIVLPRLVFKPRGTLLRLDLHNDTGAPIVTKGINLWSNAMYLGHGSPYRRYQAGFYGVPFLESTGNFFLNRTLELPDGEVTIAPNEKKAYYLWCAPRMHLPQDAEHPINKYYMTLIRALGANGEVYSPFYSEYPLKEGFTKINLRLTPEKQWTVADAFPTGHMPLAHMAEYNMASPTTLATSLEEELESSAFISYSDLGADPSLGVQISGADASDRGYYLPSLSQWRAALGNHNVIEFYSDMIFDPDSYRRQGHTQIGFESTLADYGLNREYRMEMHHYAFDSGTLRSYALRFIGNANRQLTAYRYELKSKTVAGRMVQYLEIKARYLGPRFVGDYGTISDERFWAQPDANEVTRTLLLAGDSGRLGSGLYTIYLESLSTAYIFFTIYNGHGRLEFQPENSDSSFGYLLPVRLFMRNPPAR